MSELSGTLGIATYHRPDGRFLIRLVGSLDATNAERLLDEVTQIYPTVGDRVELNVEDVTLLDFTGIGALVYSEAFVKARGGDFVMCSPSPVVRASLEQAGLERFAGCVDDLRSAAATHRAPHG